MAARGKPSSISGGMTVRRPDADWSELVAALEEPGQRTELALGLVKTALRPLRRLGCPLPIRCLRFLRDCRHSGATVSRLWWPCLAGFPRPGYAGAANFLPGFRLPFSRSIGWWSRHSWRRDPRRRPPRSGCRRARTNSLSPAPRLFPRKLRLVSFRRDAEEASAWIGRLPPGIGRDRAVRA